MPVLLSPTLLTLLQPAQDSASFHRFQEGVPAQPPPLPGGITTVLRSIFNAPLWMWLIAIAVGLTVATILGRLMWRNRTAIWRWLVTSDRGVKLALGSAGGLILALVTWMGVTSWNYMEHENAFCVGCHIMEGPWNKFSSDAGKHSDLECHDCHKQSLYASTRQLVLWVANRPEEIPAHAPVPNERCESCHAQDHAESWTKVVRTAGHRTHLESDSTALKDVLCVTCHGKEVHAFIPANETCGTSGCHENLEIRLGKMALQTTLHCNQCHQFTAEVPLLATRDSAANTLRPGSQQCLGCHEMQQILATFDPSKDPHGGSCGTCHNPHTQETPQAAGQTCTTAGCHANWRETPFHTGTSHRRVGEQCLTCHNPHAAKVDASDCVACHTTVTNKYGALRVRPLPFDTTRALRPIARHESLLDEPVRGKGDVPPPDLPPSPRPAELQPAKADSFPHPRHSSLACITCHVAPNQPTGRLTFLAPRGCQICHHQRAETNNCATCHQPGELGTSLALTIPIATKDKAPRPRAVSFAHDTHTALRCQQCHTQPVSLAPTAAVRTCADCHADHHTAQRNCASCHTGAELRTAHAENIAATHQACDACHTSSTVALLTPDRSFCVTCHQPQVDHYARRECTTCHFLLAPAAYRPHLLQRPPA
ncbi:MAG: hypothetical protein SGI84_01265 [Gemmatimonadota bacterium]|nr:hypothetical protein [Gemmatimonadota bacterium]